MCIFHLIDLEGLVYDHGTYVFPEWTAVLGWCVLAFIVVPVPLFGILAISQADGKSIIQVMRPDEEMKTRFSNLSHLFTFQKLANSMKSQLTECPCCRRGVHGLKDTHSMVHLDGGVHGDPHSAYTFAEFAEIAYPEDGSYTITSASSLPFTPSTLNSPLTPTITVQYPSEPALNRITDKGQSQQHQAD